jgi:hypothetical protein
MNSGTNSKTKDISVVSILQSYVVIRGLRFDCPA